METVKNIFITIGKWVLCTLLVILFAAATIFAAILALIGSVFIGGYMTYEWVREDNEEREKEIVVDVEIVEKENTTNNLYH